VADSLRAQATKQLKVSDELGVPLEWHVKKTEVQSFKNALGSRLSGRITFIGY
jgi:hypothetical protein